MKYIKVIICLFVLIVCGYLYKYLSTNNSKNYYALTTVVVKLDNASDIVTCQDFNGNLWEFHGVEDWQRGDIASLLMHNNNTSDIYDDIIINAYYDGWLEDFLTDHYYQ